MAAPKNDLEKREQEQVQLDERDAEYRANWEKQQREAYPEIYAEADRRKALLAAQEGLQDTGPRIVGLEPGHDPTLQASKESQKAAEAIEEGGTAGSDNLPPHDTTPQAATSQPAPGSIDTVTSGEPDSLAAQVRLQEDAPKTEPKTKDEEKPKGGDKK